MVGGVSSEPDFEDAISYVVAVKEAFQDEPAKYEEFKKLLTDYRAHRINSAILVARVEELMRDHWKLLPGFSVFHPKAKSTIPPEAKINIPPEAKATISLEAKTNIPPEAKTNISLEVKANISPEAKTNISTDANKGLGQFHQSSELTIDDSRSYVAAVKEAFHDEPEKYQEFLQILKYVITHRADEAICFARVRELMKDHRNLLLGFNDFLSAEAKITIPPEANRTIRSEAKTTIPPEANRTIRSEAKTTIPPDANRTFPPEIETTIAPEAKTTIPPEAKKTIILKAKRTIILKAKRTIPPVAKSTIPPETNRTIPLEAKRIIHPEAGRTIPPEVNRTIPLEANRTIPPEVKTIIAPDAKTITPPEAKIAIIPKAKRTIPLEAEHRGAESNYTKRKRVEPDSANFMEKLKTRFRTLDTHVVESFCKIMKKFQKGKKSEKEVHEEVVDLLYYHEDLIEEFSRFLSKKYYLY